MKMYESLSGSALVYWKRHGARSWHVLVSENGSEERKVATTPTADDADNVARALVARFDESNAIDAD